MTEAFLQYVALGDSMSIDLYPALELAERGLSHTPSQGPGAASLFYRNDDLLWPEFHGLDLVSMYGEIARLDLTTDGATTDDVALTQIPRARSEGLLDAAVITLTVGGNDLLRELFVSGASERLERATEEVARRYTEVVDAIRLSWPDALLILSTTYDPTDGTGDLPGVSDILGPLPIHLLGRFNARVRDLTQRVPGAMLADVHRHFLGHGVRAAPAKRWYWEHNLIEPGVRGASEIRRLWLEALRGGGAKRLATV